VLTRCGLCQVARAADFGRNDTVLVIKTHLGNVLKPGDMAWGYDVGSANLVDPELEKYRNPNIPDVVLVRKSYTERRRARREHGKGAQRPWRLKRMALEAAEAAGRGDAEERRRAEEEAFMQELEEDPELRSRVALYRDPAVQLAAPRRAHPLGMAEDEEEEDDDVPEVPLEELLEDMGGLSLGAGGGYENGGGEEEDEQDEDMES